MASPSALPAFLASERLRDKLWRGDQLAAPAETISSGFRVLDDQLPGGGWPTHGLTELLLPEAGIGEIRLLAPSLKQVADLGRQIVLLAPPQVPLLDGWSRLGIAASRILLIVPARLGDWSWAVEQTLRSGAFGALVVWLPEAARELRAPLGPRLGTPLGTEFRPQLRLDCAAGVSPAPRPALGPPFRDDSPRDFSTGLRGGARSDFRNELPHNSRNQSLRNSRNDVHHEALRRMQLAAASAGGLSFLFRPIEAHLESSPAPLRLLLEAGAGTRRGSVDVRILKRRGPVLSRTLTVDLPEIRALRPRQPRVLAIAPGLRTETRKAAALAQQLTQQSTQESTQESASENGAVAARHAGISGTPPSLSPSSHALDRALLSRFAA